MTTTNTEKLVFQKIGNYEPKTEEFIWEIDGIPTRTQIRATETRCQSSQSQDGLIKVRDIRFKTGLLAHTENEWKIWITSTVIKCSFAIVQEVGVHWCLTSADVKFYSKNQLQSSFKFNKSSIKPGSYSWKWNGELKIPNTVCWNDDVDQIRFHFLLQHTETGTINPPAGTDTDTNAKKRKTIVDSDSQDYSCTSDMWNISSEFFLSKDYSDCIFVCEGQEFPSHKLLLSIRSPVFYRMLRPGSVMQEAKEGKVVITDMTAKVLKEFLRFMYYGKIENLRDIADSLILPADKYDLPNLKEMCEKSLLEQVSLENALTLYFLADSVQANTLMVKSLDCIRTNKSKIFQNSEDFVNFSQKYPGAMFQLFKA